MLILVRGVNCLTPTPAPEKPVTANLGTGESERGGQMIGIVGEEDCGYIAFPSPDVREMERLTRLFEEGKGILNK